MTQLLKKIKDDHYVVVTDEPIKEGDWIYWNKKLVLAIGTSYNSDTKKVTHSTSNVGGFSSLLEAGIKELDLSYIKSLVGEVDVEKIAEEWGDNYRSFKAGYQHCLSDNKDKRFSEDDMRNIAKFFYNYKISHGQLGVIEDIDLYLFSLTQPKDTWEVYFDSDNNLKLK